MAGTFITFEGIEGCGKTTQVRLLAEHLKRGGHDVLTTREPGGTAIGDQIRRVLLSAHNNDMEPMTEFLLYAAQRCQHVHEVIVPAIEAGKTVLCDRYADATTAYQGAARSIDADLLEKIHERAASGLMPDLTLLFDCPPDTGLARAIERNVKNRSEHEDRFERESIAFHKRVREGYLAIARQDPGRVKVIDATGDIESIHKRVVEEATRAIG